MNTIIISALTANETEIMVKSLDRCIRNYFNSYGAHRRNSWNRKANDGIRAQIRVSLPAEQWDYIKEVYASELVHKLNKSISVCSIVSNIIEVSTEEADI